MTLYTGRGDEGETDLLGGKRVRKDDLRIEAVGAVDELNAALGLVTSFLGRGEALEILEEVQNRLFTVGAEIGQGPGKALRSYSPLAEAAVAVLEEAIDRLETRVGEQRAFVLPGGSREAALLHYARAVTRRAERKVVALASKEELNPQILRYLNRLSSLLHALALHANVEAGVEERHPSYA